MGSVRTSSLKAKTNLNEKGFDMDASVYSDDCIETPEDILELESVLAKYTSRSGSQPKFTLNFVMANPDFNKIADANFTKYYYTPFYREKSLFDGVALSNAWNEAIERGCFVPQLHCREHIKWWSWLNDMKNKNSDAYLTFDYSMCGVPKVCSPTKTSYFEPLYIDDEFLRTNPNLLSNMITEGAWLFEQHFGFKSKTAIAPVAFWNSVTEDLWAARGIKGIQSPWVQTLQKENTVSEIPRYLGQRNENNQVYLLRNCTFEPRKKTLGIRRCIRDIARAFNFSKPAIISTHRMNYVSSINRSTARPH